MAKKMPLKYWLDSIMCGINLFTVDGTFATTQCIIVPNSYEARDEDTFTLFTLSGRLGLL